MHKLLKACMHDSLYKGCQNISFVIQFDATFAMDNMSTMLHKKSMPMGPMLIMMTLANTGMKLWTTDVLPEQH